MRPQRINAGEAHENGDIEQRHHRFKRAVEQSLLLRGSRDFDSRQSYEQFLKTLFKQLHAGRRERFEEELAVLGALPQRWIDDCRKERVKVGPSSTVRIRHNTYSVHSRLRGEWVEARVYAQRIEIWYGQRKVETLSKLTGENKHRINYRHIIEWLVRKPGAFAQYRYREELFPGSWFRMAYDELRAHHAEAVATRQYLQLLYLAATESESAVEGALRQVLNSAEPISVEAVQGKLRSGKKPDMVQDVPIAAVSLAAYDGLLECNGQEVVNG